MGFDFKSSDQGPLSEINITPFVDVTLVLLIIFMVTAPMLDNGIAVELPKASAKALPKNETPLILHVTKEKNFYLGNELIPSSSLTEILQKAVKARKDQDLYIRAAETLPYGFVAQTMAAIKEAGITRLGLVTSPVGTPPPKGETKKGR